MRRVAPALFLMLAACTGPQSALDPAGDQAAQLHGLLILMLWVCGAVYLLVIGFLAAALWRARRALEGPPNTAPEDRRLGKGLTAWVALIVVGLTSLAIASFLVDRALARQGETGPVAIRATGHQWWWRLEYRDPATGAWIETANELHLPSGRPTRIEVVSSDVIHSFWIPNLSGKIDMIPGRTNQITITPRREGWYRGQCAEFCGMQHAQMALDVKVESPGAYAAWLAGQSRLAAAPTDPIAARGLAVVSSGPCAMCHSIRGAGPAGRAGPDLTHVASRRSLAAGVLPMSRAGLQGWISQPQALKPGAEMPPSGLSPQDANAVSRYLEGLS